ncbi:uncharacterized protein HMF8227_02922 [Saliniradius amylolyticus]|uniref:DUF484 domain-containing protein n=1 Tax=Saliniradius amylolyticus TaxID=2183582 RepID=A0A2S2E836_9ALTE|nr:DUF484 family protein [Saliniradius amylolyticus]AWL13370.1 uncharacterized protein HMF8227_02922 [Saliniradius amylolyticus]
MSDQPLNASTNAAEAVSAAQVKRYLQSHPDFFAQHPELLEGLRIPHQQKGAVSLVELQSEQLRSRLNQLQHQINELMSVAKHNERIYRIYADLNLRLFQCQTQAQIRSLLEDVLLEQLDLQDITLMRFDREPELSAEAKKQLEEKRFRQDMYYFGRLSQQERAWLFGEDSQVASVAMMLIGEQGELGLLVIGSSEDHHFHPGMDTLLINQLQKFMTLVLSQLEQ